MEQSGQLVWLITTRSQVRILPPQPRKNPQPNGWGFFLRCAYKIQTYDYFCLWQKVAAIAPLRFAPPLAWKICKHIFTAHRYTEPCPRNQENYLIARWGYFLGNEVVNLSAFKFTPYTAFECDRQISCQVLDRFCL